MSRTRIINVVYEGTMSVCVDIERLCYYREGVLLSICCVVLIFDTNLDGIR